MDSADGVIAETCGLGVAVMPLGKGVEVGVRSRCGVAVGGAARAAVVGAGASVGVAVGTDVGLRVGIRVAVGALEAPFGDPGRDSQAMPSPSRSRPCGSPGPAVEKKACAACQVAKSVQFLFGAGWFP